MKQMDNGETAIYDGKYIGKTMCGFVHGESYACKVSRTLYGYNIEQIDEYVEIPAFMRYASVISINQNWEFKSN